LGRISKPRNDQIHKAIGPLNESFQYFSLPTTPFLFSHTYTKLSARSELETIEYIHRRISM